MTSTTTSFPRSHSPAGTLADRQVQVETPEHVALDYELAGLGSRFAALLLDTLLILAGVVVVFLGMMLASLDPVPDWLGEMGKALMIVAIFLWTYGYFVLYEGLRDGQTPGKRALGIRTVHDGGYALTMRGAAVRNLLRIIDVQPAMSCLVGGGVMMFHPQSKRLGDLAAGTVVVRDRPGAALPEENAGEAGAAGPPRLSAEELELLARYVARRAELPPHVRTATAGRLAARVAPRFEDDERQRHNSPDGWLVLLYADETARHRAAALRGRGNAQAAALVRRQRGRWDEYARLLERARTQGLARLPARDVSRFAALYRELSADLARARTYGGSPELVYMLERSVGAGHNLLYRPAQRSWALLKDWLSAGFPALVRRRWRPVALATACLYLPAVVTFGVLRADPARARDVVPAVIMARAEEARVKEARGEGYVEFSVLEMPGAATGLMTHNSAVSFGAFAGGILAGAGTLFAMVFNGVHLGSAMAVFANLGVAMHIFTFIAPHGAVELTALCIAGGAGFLLAAAILVPGRRSRRQALAENGREAVSLIAGTTMMLVIAGLIEGFVSPSDLPRPAKLAFAAVVALLLAAYLGFAGRGKTRTPVEPGAAAP
jgi:uncharacterized membrane protein SpoIIM required for sporulation/uncharacterized RDD family membrane protein YckC